MTDDQLIREIQKLHQITTKLHRVQSQVSNLNFSQFKTAGSHQWSGSVKDHHYDEQFQQGQKSLRQVGPEIQAAIQACQRKMTHLAWQVKDIPKKAEAFRIAIF